MPNTTTTAVVFTWTIILFPCHHLHFLSTANSCQTQFYHHAVTVFPYISTTTTIFILPLPVPPLFALIFATVFNTSHTYNSLFRVSWHGQSNITTGRISWVWGSASGREVIFTLFFWGLFLDAGSVLEYQEQMQACVMHVPHHSCFRYIFCCSYSLHS